MKKTIIDFLKKISFKIATRYWNKNDIISIANKHFKLLDLLHLPLTYKTDGLYTIHNCDFIQDKLFAESYKYGKLTGSWGDSDLQWRAYIGCWIADKVKNYEGDFVECGVNKGGLSRTIINYVNFNSLKKKFYLMDTFNGLDDRYISETERKQGIRAGGYEECYNLVKKNFEGFNVEIIRGTIPETLPQVKTDKICYLSIDMNCVEPEIAAAEYFWDKLVDGGIILLDDYGWAMHIAQKNAFDEFAKQKGHKVLSLPTGQGIIIK